MTVEFKLNFNENSIIKLILFQIQRRIKLRFINIYYISKFIKNGILKN